MCRLKGFLTSLLLILFCVSCGVTYKVRNQHAEIEYYVYSPCGKVGLELVGRGDSKFTIIQRFELDFEAYTNPGSLFILLNDEPVEYEHSVSGAKVLHKAGISRAEIKFETSRRVKDGDIIAVSGQNYLNCRDNMTGIDTIYYKFANRLIIHGVNSF